jgi:hypothetical protein
MHLVESAPGSVTSAVGSRDVPSEVRALGTFDAPDYVDFFSVSVPGAAERSAEGWARAVLERSRLAKQHARRLWTALGLRLGRPGSPDHVAGWRIAASERDWIRFETGSWYLTAEAVCVVDEDDVSLSLALRFDRRLVARLVWSFIEGPHRRAVPDMLRQAAATWPH